MALRHWWNKLLTDPRQGQGDAPSNLMMEVDSDFPIDVIRTKRKKTAAIKIVEGRVQVIVPKRLSRKRIDELIWKRASWIREKLQIQSESVPIKLKEYISGERFTYLGKNYRLKLTEDDLAEVKLKSGQLVLGVDKNLSDKQREKFVKEQLVKWYKKRAEQRLNEKISHYAKIVGVEPRSVAVKTYKSRWGSCSIHGDISFNWKLIIAPHHVVDYVVIHELCHMHQHNHSVRFWQCVESVLPDYLECRQWLKDKEKYLEI